MFRVGGEVGHSARVWGWRGESRPGWAELAGLRQAVPNLPGSSVNPTCLEKRWSEPVEGLDGQLCQADGWLGGKPFTLECYHKPVLALSWKLGALSYTRR